MRTQVASSLVLVLALAAGLALVTGSMAPAAEEKHDAKALFTEAHKCNMCHSVKAAEIEPKTSSDKMKGPDLSGYEMTMSFEKLSAFIRKTSQLDGKDHKKGFKGSDEELKAIVDWLGSLEAQE